MADCNCHWLVIAHAAMVLKRLQQRLNFNTKQFKQPFPLGDFFQVMHITYNHKRAGKLIQLIFL